MASYNGNLPQQQEQEQQEQEQQQQEQQQQQKQPQSQPIQHLNSNPNSVLRRADSFVEIPEHPETPATNISRGGRRKEPRVLHRPRYVFNIARMEGEERNENEEEKVEENDFFKRKVRNYH